MYITKVHYVDVETGEYLARDDILKKRYIIIRKFENYDKLPHRGDILKTITYECERTKQGRLFD